MNRSGTLNHKISSAKGFAAVGYWWQTVTPRLLHFALSGNELGRIGIVILLLTLLLLLPFTLLLTLATVQAGFLITLLAWLIFGLLSVWVGSKLEYILHPERLAYRRIIEACSRLVREVSDQDLLLDRLTFTLYQQLGLEHVSIWRYQTKDRALVLARLEGSARRHGTLTSQLAELPVDLEVTHLHGTWPVSVLPESALRQGLIARGVQVVTSLSLGDELVGIIGLGNSRFGTQYGPEALHWLNLIAGQLSLAVKSAYLLTDLEDALKKLQLAYRHTIDAEDEERRRLAVELHDDILSRLTTLTLSLRNCQKQLTINPEPVKECLGMLEEETRSVNRRLREITQGLHPSVLLDLGLISALQAYMDSLVKQTLPPSAPRVITITAQGFNGDRLTEPNLERDLYYITRQALDNAIKHAHAEQVFVHLRWRQDSVSVTVQDTGQGMKEPPEQLMGQNGRLGLLSMNERVLTWRGRLTFHTFPDQGTTVHVRLPINQPSRAPTHLQAFTQVFHPQENDNDL